MGAGRQKTLNGPVEFSGIGLHTGEDCRMVLRPSVAGSGVVFFRRDLDAAADFDDAAASSVAPIIMATPENVVRACHGTTLANADGVYVSTVEHVMAALAICSIDNAVIDVFGPELPILDGSAAPFVTEIRQIGLSQQDSARSEIVIDKTIRVDDGDRSIVLEPSDSFRVSVSIDFEDCLIGQQSLDFEFDDAELLQRMARSRTFCRLYEIEALRAKNLIRGGSLKNSIVVDGSKTLNDDALRDPEEFVLHKALDLIGDLYLLGAPIRGSIRANKPGHDLNTRAALAVLEAQSVQEPARMVASA